MCLTPSWSPTLSPPAVCAPCSSTLCDLWSEPGQVTIFMIPDLIKITWENVIMYLASVGAKKVIRSVIFNQFFCDDFENINFKNFHDLINNLDNWHLLKSKDYLIVTCWSIIFIFVSNFLKISNNFIFTFSSAEKWSLRSHDLILFSIRSTQLCLWSTYYTRNDANWSGFWARMAA